MKHNILKSALLGLTLFTLVFTACTNDDEDESTTPTPTATSKSIYEIAKADTSFSYLVAALDKAGLNSVLSGTGTFTVFAPNNNAFRKEGITMEDINTAAGEDLEDLKEVLLYHVLGAKVKSTQVTNGYVSTLALVNGNGLSLRTATNPVTLNNESKVLTADIEASNGILHVIDMILIPQSIVDIALNNPAFSSLVGAVVKAELVEVLEDRTTATVFAPTDAAFNDINFNLANFSKEDLLPILTAHVLANNVRSSQIGNGDEVATLNPSTKLTFNTTNGVKFNGGKVTDIGVTTADIQATNGVVHVINKVVLP